MEDIKKFDEILRSYQSTQVINRGIGHLSLLSIALVVLKAMGYISISWVWALAPFWIPLIFSAIIVVLILCAVTIIVFYNKVSVEVKTNSESVNTSSTTTEEEQSTQKTPVVEEQVQVKSKKKRPKKKKEESNNGEQKEGAITGTETSTNK